MRIQLDLVAQAADLDISDQIDFRPAPTPDYATEKLAIQELADRMATRPDEVLPRLTSLALQLSDADAAGVSVLEGDGFRWLGLIGKLAVFEGTRTPLNYSPCGVCLEKLAPTLMENPERFYSWIADAGIVVPEVLLVPLVFKDEAPLGTLWVVAKPEQKFHAGHARLMSELAVFTGTALQMIKSNDSMKAALQKQETFAREMGHRVKNYFAVTNGLVRMTARHSATKEEMVENLLRRFVALSEAHSLAQDYHAEGDQAPVPLATILETVLRPYRSTTLSGPMVLLMPAATTNVTLVLHELATNAAKHGALSSDGGTIRISWRIEGDGLEMQWKEIGGPLIAEPPSRMGFGTTLIRSIMASLGGTIEKAWSPDGVDVRIYLPPDTLDR